MLEIIQKSNGGYKAAVFDFDGTISLISAGWQDDMCDQFTEAYLAKVNSPRDEVYKLMEQLIFKSTGLAPYVNCTTLAKTIAEAGGEPEDVDVYFAEYTRRSDLRMKNQMKRVTDGMATQDDLMVPGVRNFLQNLYDLGIKLMLVSGSEIRYVQPQCEFLGVAHFFEGRIYGPPLDSWNFSKKQCISQFIEDSGLTPEQVVNFGDGGVETQYVHEIGGYAVGLATDEISRQGVNPWKREKLIAVGADCIVPNFLDSEELLRFLQLKTR